MEEIRAKSAAFSPLRAAVEICLLIALLSAVGFTGWAAWNTRLLAANDRIAQSDYRRLRTALFNVLSDRQAPRRFFTVGHVGPFMFPEPLAGVLLSHSVRADVFHQTRRRRNQRPVTVTRLEVFHLKGNVRYAFTEVNGKVVEQILKLTQS